jgi:hypothetical protein
MVSGSPPLPDMRSDEEIEDFEEHALEAFGTPPVPSWQHPRSFRQISSNSERILL